MAAPTQAVAFARRIAGAVAVRARALPMTAGVVPYRPCDRATIADWDRDYATGAVESYADLWELARYSLLVGYLRYLGTGITVLDVGCGVGLLRERMDGLPFARYLGIDPSAEAIARAERLADERTSFLCTTLPIPEHAPFDVVVCNEVLLVVPDPARTIEDVHEAVRRGGHLLVSIWSHPGDRALRRLLDRRFAVVDSVFVRNLSRRRGHHVAMYRRS